MLWSGWNNWSIVIFPTLFIKVFEAQFATTFVLLFGYESTTALITDTSKLKEDKWDYNYDWQFNILHSALLCHSGISIEK